MLRDKSETLEQELERLDELPHYPTSGLVSEVSETSLMAELSERSEAIRCLRQKKGWPVAAIASELNIEITPNLLDLLFFRLEILAENERRKKMFEAILASRSKNPRLVFKGEQS